MRKITYEEMKKLCLFGGYVGALVSLFWLVYPLGAILIYGDPAPRSIIKWVFGIIICLAATAIICLFSFFISIFLVWAFCYFCLLEDSPNHMDDDKERDPFKEAELVLKCAEELGYEGTDTTKYDIHERAIYADLWYAINSETMVWTLIRFAKRPGEAPFLDEDENGNVPEFISVDPVSGPYSETEGLEPYQAVGLLARRADKEIPNWVIQKRNEEMNNYLEWRGSFREQLRGYKGEKSSKMIWILYAGIAIILIVSISLYFLYIL